MEHLNKFGEKLTEIIAGGMISMRNLMEGEDPTEIYRPSTDAIRTIMHNDAMMNSVVRMMVSNILDASLDLVKGEMETYSRSIRDLFVNHLKLH
jgi:hypothetical protein